MTDESSQDDKPPRSRTTSRRRAPRRPRPGPPADRRSTTPPARTGSCCARRTSRPAEIFSVSYVAHDAATPIGRSRSSSTAGRARRRRILHLGAVGPQRVAFPADGTLPPMPPRLVANEESWLAFTDLVFVDPVGTGFSRVIERRQEGRDEGRRRRQADEQGDDATDPKEYFGYKRDLESLCEFMGRWLSNHGRWGSPVFIAGESYGGYRVGRLVRMLQETAGIGLNGAILISPALEFATLVPNDYDVLAWVDLLPTMALAAVHHGRSRAFAAGAPLEDVLQRGRVVRHRRLHRVPDARCVDARGRARADPRADSPTSSASRSTSSPAPRAASRCARSRASSCATSARCSASTTRRSRRPTRSRTGSRSPAPTRRSPGIDARVHDGDQPAAALGDRRRDRPRVHAAELRGQQRLEATTRRSTSSSRPSARPTTSATACR